MTNDLLRSLLADANGGEVNATELQNADEALSAFALAHAAPPQLRVRAAILAKINALNAQKAHRSSISLEAVPFLTPDANFLDWATAVRDIPAPILLEDVFLHPIRSDEQVDIFVAWVKVEVPTEVHHDLLESFILLEGTCECVIQQPDGTSRVVHMREGDYISFKLGETHDIFITSSSPAKAILQWLKVAA